MNSIELLKIEFIKVKRSKILPILFIAPLLVVVSGVMSISRYLTENPGGAWQAMFVQGGLLFGYYLLPLSMVVVCILLSERERQHKGIVKMLSLPVSRIKMATAKFIVLLSFLAIEIIFYFLCFIIAGLTATQTMGVNEVLPMLYVLKWSTLLFTTAIPCTALIWLITVLFEKPLFSIGLNMLLIIPGILVANTSIWTLYPYSYSGYVVTTELDRLSTGATKLGFQLFPFLPCAIAILVLCVFIANRRFGKKEMM